MIDHTKANNACSSLVGYYGVATGSWLEVEVWVFAISEILALGAMRRLMAYTGPACHITPLLSDGALL
jgi:hypothetical protein